MTDDPIPNNPFPNKARRAGAKLTPTPVDRPVDVRLLGFTSPHPEQREAERKAAADQLAARLPEPPPTRAVGESIRPRIGDELGPTSLDTEVRDMTVDALRRMAHRRLTLELADVRETMEAAAKAARQAKLRQAELVWGLEAEVTELRARDMSIVGAVVRTLRKRLRGDR